MAEGSAVPSGRPQRRGAGRLSVSGSDGMRGLAQATDHDVEGPEQDGLVDDADEGGADGRPVRELKGIRGESVEHVPVALDRLIHERLRLGIVSALAVNDVLSFADLKKLLHTTDGNLSVHARKLEEAGYVACFKGFRGRVPRTEYRLTESGKEALERYLDHMEALINATREHA